MSLIKETGVRCLGFVPHISLDLELHAKWKFRLTKKGRVLSNQDPFRFCKAWNELERGSCDMKCWGRPCDYAFCSMLMMLLWQLVAISSHSSTFSVLLPLLFLLCRPHVLSKMTVSCSLWFPLVSFSFFNAFMTLWTKQITGPPGRFPVLLVANVGSGLVFFLFFF